jgi:hypothetical protein
MACTMPSTMKCDMFVALMPCQHTNFIIKKPKTKDWSNQNALLNQCLEVIANTHICEWI